MKIVIVFKISSNLRNFDFKIKKPRLDFDILFIIRFRLISLNKTYEIYRKTNYSIYNYKILISLRFSNEMRFFLLKDKLLVL